MEGAGFDPTEFRGTIERVGFGLGDVRLRVEGRLTRHGDLLAIELPTEPDLVVLAGGAKERELTAAELRVGSLILVEGELHPSHADQPPGMEVDRWEKVEPASPRDQGRQVDDPESTDRRAN